MSIHRKLMTVCCGAVLAFGLAACGTSGDDSTAGAPAVERPTGPTQADLVDAEKMRADEAEKKLADAEAAAALATAKALIAAIDAPASFAVPADAETPPVVRQVRAAYGKAPAVAVRAGTDATVDITPPFSVTDDPADSISGWAGYNYSRKDSTGGGSAEMVVYTNIGMPANKPFTETHADGIGGTLDLGNDYLMTNVAKVASPGFAAQGHKVHDAASRSFDGTFDGAPGTYSCPDTAAGMHFDAL